MKKFLLFCIAVLLVFVPDVFANDGFFVEAALGGWYPNPSGSINNKSVNDIRLSDNLGYDDKATLTGRLKLNMPFVIPNIYITGAPLSFDENGKIAGFTFGGHGFPACPFSSTLDFNQYDIAFFWEIPFVSLATLGGLSVEAGLNGRIIDMSANIKDAVNSVSKDSQTFVPMVYGSAIFSSASGLALELEARLSSYDDQHWYSGTARIKQEIGQVFFIGGGYRYDDIDMETDGVKIDTQIKGPFVEAGVCL